MNNNKIFEENLNLIKDLTFKNWIPAEIARKIGMERHALLYRLRKHNLKINKRCNSYSEYKVCSECKENKPIDSFNKSDRVKNTYSSLCKNCRKNYLNLNKEKSILSQIKNNAKQRGYDFNLTIEDILIPEYCPILKVKLDSSIYRYSPSVDRIDSKKGYIKGNIQIISTKANNMKNDASLEELLAFSKYFLEKLKK